MKPSGAKRNTLAHISYSPKRGSWGGSVPAFFNTTHQEIQIDDTLTPGKRMSITAGALEFEVSGSIKPKEVGNWEEQFESRRKLSGPVRRNLRPKIGSVRVVSEGNEANIERLSI